MNRRTFLSVCASAVATSGLAGCVDEVTKSTGRTEGTTNSDSRTHRSEPAGATGTDDATASDEETTVHAVDRPEPDHAIWVRNEHDVSHRIAVTVTRLGDGDPDEVVYETTLEQDPNGSDIVYNLRESNPDGVDRFEVAAETGDQAASRYIATSECYLDLSVVVRADGELVVQRSIC